MNCKECVWYARVHYKGTPEDEIYDECERHNTVLHEDELGGCRDYSEDPAVLEE